MHPEDANGTAIDRKGIRQTFIDHQKDLAKCYETALVADKSIKGKVVLYFEIREAGKVGPAPHVVAEKSTLNNETLNLCLVEKLKDWTFPNPPRVRETVVVYYPLAFSNN